MRNPQPMGRETAFDEFEETQERDGPVGLDDVDPDLVGPSPSTTLSRHHRPRTDSNAWPPLVYGPLTEAGQRKEDALATTCRRDWHDGSGSATKQAKTANKMTPGEPSAIMQYQRHQVWSHSSRAATY